MRKPAQPCVLGVAYGGRRMSSSGRNCMKKTPDGLCFLCRFFNPPGPCDLSWGFSHVTLTCSPANTLETCTHHGPLIAQVVIQQKFLYARIFKNYSKIMICQNLGVGLDL